MKSIFIFIVYPFGDRVEIRTYDFLFPLDSVVSLIK